MAIQVQIRRGTATQNNAFTGAIGELTFDTTNKQVRAHDGSTAGGHVVSGGGNFATGANNVVLGNAALDSLDASSPGGSNVAVGTNALTANTTASSNTAVGKDAGSLITTGQKNTILGAFDGNEGGLDIRTASSHIVLSDGDGNPRLIIDDSGNVDIGGETTELKLKNTTHEDTDGGRESKITFQGEQSGGEQSVLAQIQASHDATADDQKGDLIFRTNDGADGTSPTEAMRIDSAQNIGIGIDSPTAILDVRRGDASGKIAEFHTSTGYGIELGSSQTEAYVQTGSSQALLFNTNGSNERMRIDSAGRLLIGTTTEGQNQADNLTVSGSGHTGITIRSTDSNETAIFFSDGTSGEAEYKGALNYIHSDDSMRFSANVGERMRLTSGGALLVGTTSDPSTNERIRMGVTSGSKNGIAASATDTNGGTALICFKSTGSSVGSVSFNNNNTAFNTSSDYRLKENVTNVSDGITRVKQLAPKRFNWIDDDSNTAVDGFLAHEVQTVVPEAITGAKDAMIEEVLYVDGDELPEGKKVGDVKTASTIDPQNIDQSKLVPLLAAALKEAIAKIETLETKVAALEG